MAEAKLPPGYYEACWDELKKVAGEQLMDDVLGLMSSIEQSMLLDFTERQDADN